MDTIRRNQELKRMDRDIRQMREQIVTLKAKQASRMIERTNLIFSEVYNGGE